MEKGQRLLSWTRHVYSQGEPTLTMTSEVKPDGCRTTETYSDVMENQAGVSEGVPLSFPVE